VRTTKGNRFELAGQMLKSGNEPKEPKEKNKVKEDLVKEDIVKENTKEIELPKKKSANLSSLKNIEKATGESVSVYLNKGQVNKLRNIAEAEEIPISKIIGFLIDNYL